MKTGESVAVHEMRKHAARYLKGIRGNATVCKFINGTEIAVELRALLNGFVDVKMEREQTAFGITAV